MATLGEKLWEGPDYTAYGGYTLALHEDVLLIGGPVEPQEGAAGDPFVSAISLDDGVELGRWTGANPWALTGLALAVTDLEGDGVVEVAVGEPNGQPSSALDGTVYLLSGLPSGEQPIEEEALLTFYSPDHVAVGGDVLFADLRADETTQLVASGGGMLPDWPGCIYAIDPSLRGVRTEEDATRTLCGRPGLGFHTVGWDGDLDGQLDIVTSTLDGIAWLRGPWETDLIEDDIDAAWTQDYTLGWDIQEHIEALGDLTGDGEPDLSFAAGNHGEPEERAGRAYLVPAGDLQSGPADDIAL